MTIIPMAKWIWLGLFVLTVGATIWLGRNEQPRSQSNAKALMLRQKNIVDPVDSTVIETERPLVSILPMAPNLIRAPEPSPYVDSLSAVPGDESTPPPNYGAGFEPEPNFPPPPVQNFPQESGGGGAPNSGGQGTGSESPPEMDGEPLPEYLRPQPGMQPNDQSEFENVAPPDEEF